MHFNLRKAAVVSVLPLLGGALAVGATALPASAQTFQDTALQAFNLTQPTTTTGAVVNGVASGTGKGSTLSFTAPSGEVFTTPSFTAGTTDASLTTHTATSLVLTSGGTVTGSGKLTFTIASASSAVGCSATETVMVSESGGALGESATPPSTTTETVTVSVFNNNTNGTVEFSATVIPASCPVTFSESNLPPGLTSGNPLVPGSSAPRTGNNFYDGVRYTVTDSLGSTFTGGTFDLYVFGHELTPPPPPPGNFGDEVNPFGNGFDVFQQHQAVNAVIAGWTATQADPATHFLRHAGTVSGAFQFEYAPHGSGTVLCV